ncbi:MAG: hypothetical protein U1E02_30250 [Hydrogenophaga sp.]|nr:hypothetical protein [Hydrogenophaga sp.]
MNKPTRNRIVTTSLNQAKFAAFMKNSPREVTSQRLSLGRLFDPNWANADLCASVHAQLPLHMPPMLIEFIKTALSDATVRRAYLQPRLHASQLELLTPWKGALDAGVRAYLSPMLSPNEADMAFTAAFVAPISRFTVLLPVAESGGGEPGSQAGARRDFDQAADESTDEGGEGDRPVVLPTDPNTLRADLLHDALRQLARRSTGMADTLSVVLNLDRAAFDVAPEQVARLTGVVALAVTPLHNLWPVTVQERALSVKYLRP